MTDHTSPCQILQDCSTDTKDRLDKIEMELNKLTSMKDDMTEIKKNINNMGDILETWNNINGFGVTVKFIAKTAAVFSVFTGIAYAFASHFKL